MRDIIYCRCSHLQSLNNSNIFISSLFSVGQQVTRFTVTFLLLSDSSDSPMKLCCAELITGRSTSNSELLSCQKPLYNLHASMCISMFFSTIVYFMTINTILFTTLNMIIYYFVNRLLMNLLLAALLTNSSLEMSPSPSLSMMLVMSSTHAWRRS